MGSWTDWRKIADRRAWYDQALDWNGPACYELAIAGPHGGDLRIVYVGETANERTRVADYARSGSHLAEIIDDHLRRGWSLFYRARATPSKVTAVRMQNQLLSKFVYDWNIQLNAETKH